MSPPCRLCGDSTRRVHSATILGKYRVDYLQCESCELLQTEDPYWLDEAYQHPINVVDTGILILKEFEKSLILLAILNIF